MMLRLVIQYPDKRPAVLLAEFHPEAMHSPGFRELVIQRLASIDTDRLRARQHPWFHRLLQRVTGRT